MATTYSQKDSQTKSQKTKENSLFFKELEKRILLFDGAMGTEIQNHNPTIEDYNGKEGCNEYLVLTKPEIIESIHESYLKAGCDVVETDTFGGSRHKLGEYGIGDKVYEVNFQAAQIARKAAEKYSSPDKPRFVAGSMGPTGFLPSSDDPDLGNITFSELSDMFSEQAKALVEGGVDVLLIETSQDILEMKAAIFGIHQYFRESGHYVPLIAQITLDVSGRMLLGTDIGSALTTLETIGVDIVGMNCSTGPEHMREPARYLCENTELKISCVPNAGLPINQDGLAVYPLKPDEMASEMVAFVSQFGVNIIGGCCGTTPEHIRKMAEKINDLKPKTRTVQKPHYASSAMKTVSLVQEPRPLIIGERLNSQGSRKVKRLLLEEDYNSLINIARDQVEGGAHVLDVCVALTERDDEAEVMKLVVKKLAMSVEAPLVIDSTDHKVIEEALKTYPGSVIINSINLENGRERVEAILPLAKEYGASVIALTIDEKGMAKTVDHKVEVAKRIYDIYTNEYALEPGSLIFDVLTFTLATGEEEWVNSAMATLEGIKEVKKQLPGVLTTLGLSNVSFGLKPNARKVLNSVFLYHAVQKGLDSAIVNPKDIIPYPSISEEERELAEDLIFNRKPDALITLSSYFEENVNESSEESLAKEEASLSVEEAIHHKILHRVPDDIEALLDEAMEKYNPVDILNNILLKAMKEVGDKFGSGELILPFVLQSAEVMKRAVSYLENFLEKKEGSTKGTILLATVYGDVHDIGKNLVKTILSNNGYTVHDIGKQVPVNTIIEKALELKVDAIGLSALLVSTSKQMGICVQELHSRGLNYPVLVGGAAINRKYGHRISLIDDKTPYDGAVFYAKDAFEGLDVMDRLSNEDKKDIFIQKVKEEALQSVNVKDKPKETVQTNQENKSNVKQLSELLKPPFWGIKVLKETDLQLEEIFKHLSLSELYRLSWGGRGKSKEDYQKLVEEEFRPTLDKLKDEVMNNNLFLTRIVYGYFPCQSEGNSLFLYDPKNQDKQIAQFTFPRQTKAPWLCLSDYFTAKASGQMDVLPMQVVTVGDKVTGICDALNENGDYTKAYYLHGLAVQTAEAMADYNHHRILNELKIPMDQGKRFSFGYPACPELDDQEALMKVLNAEKEIGVSITSAFQLVPEQSTSALIIPHPEAVYYRV